MYRLAKKARESGPFLFIPSEKCYDSKGEI